MLGSAGDRRRRFVDAGILVRFSLLSALSTQNDPPEQASKPFSKNRDGFVLAEGGGALVLEDLDHARARGARVLGILEGCGEKSDSFHRTRSSPDGKPIIACMRNALADAGVGAEDVDYINAHGTSTPENDKMEHLGVSAVFGERIRGIPISSNKSMIGHTLTAAGAVEAVFSLLTLEHQRIPPTINHNVPDPAISARRRAQRGARRAGHPRHLQFVRLRRPERLPGHDPGAGVSDAAPPALGGEREAHARSPQGRGGAEPMRALSLVGDRKIELVEIAAPAAPAAGEVQIAIKAIGLNHIDVWGWRGMAFAKRKLPLIVGVEAAGEIVAVGPSPAPAATAASSEAFNVGDPVVAYGD